MTARLQILGLVALIAMPVLTVAGQDRQNGTKPQSENDSGDFLSADVAWLLAVADGGSVFADGQLHPAGEPPFLVRGQGGSNYGATAVRFGWWSTATSGSVTKVGEYQGLDSSPFFDVDHLSSDGRRTVDFFVTGTDNETTQTGLNFYGPNLSVDFEYQRFLHRLDHDPMTNFYPFDGSANGFFPSQPRFTGVDGPLSGAWSPNPVENERVATAQDLNEGEDYAIRVQELEAKFKGNLSENVQWGLNLWGMRKTGEREAQNMSHCFNGDTVDTGVSTHPPVPAGSRQCHLLNQRQRIDWLTMEIEPVIKAKFGAVSVEYSRLMRSFNQNDDPVSRNHTTNRIDRSIGDVGDGAIDQDPANAGTVVGYAFVPENYTEIDRLKVHADLGEATEFYANMFVGNTRNQNRDTNRNFNGWDLRLTDRSLNNLSLTGYAKKFTEKSQMPPFVALDGTEVIPTGPDAGTNRIVRPWEREKTSAGIKGRWRRYQGSPHAFTSGYDYTLMDRAFTEHETTHPDQTWDQSATVYHTLKARLNSRWSSYFDTNIEYTRQWVQDPLFAAHEPNGVTNSSQPTDVDLVQFGGTWTPSYNFLVSAWVGIENRSRSDAIANFEEDNYPIVCNAWWAPSSQWSISAGYAYYSNYITQDITLGDQTDRWVDKGTYWRKYLDPITSEWGYTGTSNVINLGASYAHSESLTLSGTFEYVRGDNRFDSPSPAAYNLTDPANAPNDFPVNPDWSDLPGYSRVLVETYRFTAGIDYLIHDGVSCYVRYNYFDYDGQSFSELFNSGTAHFILGGVTAVF